MSVGTDHGDYRTLALPLDDGVLTIGSWGRGDVLALAIHGLTLNHAEYHHLGEALAVYGRLLAPDLRGRGASVGVDPPYGIDAHVEDIAAILHRETKHPIVLIGHSWGAVVALAAACRYPDLVRSVLLVDGGLPPAPGPATKAASDRQKDLVLARLRSRFPSVDAYLSPWRAHPGLRDHWDDRIERAFRHDLTGEAPNLRCNMRAEAFTADLETAYAPGVAERALLGLLCRAVVVRAGRNMADEPLPPVSKNTVREWQARVPNLTDRLVETANHYTIVMAPSGAALVADMVCEEHRNPGDLLEAASQDASIT